MRQGDRRPDGGLLCGLRDVHCRELVGQDLLRAAGVVQGGLGRLAFDPHARRDGIPQGALGLGA